MTIRELEIETQRHCLEMLIVIIMSHLLIEEAQTGKVMKDCVPLAASAALTDAL